jgi:hypothetical protein
MRRIAVVVLLLALAVPSFAQGGPELDALADAFFAKDLKTVLKHLPPELEKAFAGATLDKQRMLAERFMWRTQIEKDGVKFVRPDSGSGPVLVIEPPAREQTAANERVEVYLDRRMSDGNETMLRFRVKTPREDEFDRRAVATFWMRYVDGQWRVYEFDADGESVKFDDPKFLAMLTDSYSNRPAANEASAVGSVRTLNTAALTYAASFEEIGYPGTLASIGGNGDQCEPPNPDHACLIDPVLASGEKSGYRFTFVRTGKDEYHVTARPIEFGTTGTRSFYSDQSGVIRMTSEDREPTVEDPPLR